jgi:ABC-type spermidine/putrescine transport system permease subunit II
MGRDISKLALAFYTSMVGALIYAPISTMILFSFNSSSRTVPPFDGPSIVWYYQALGSSQITDSLVRSMELALVTTATSTIIFTLAGISYRKNFRAGSLLFYIITLGIIMPGITYSLGLALFYKNLGIPISLWTALPAHLVWTIPWGLILVRATIDPNILVYEDAARTLGANEWKIVRYVTLPLFLPAVIGGALFAFTLSFTDLVRSVFVTFPDTLPLQTLALSQLRVAPDLFATGSIIVMVSLALLAMAALFLRKIFSRITLA